MQITARMIERASQEWTALAGGLPIRVEETTGNLYAFGEELAILRLFHKMGCGRAAFSKNMQSWYWVNN